MAFTGALFGFEGRLARLPFFGYLMFMYLVVVLIGGVGVSFVGSSDGNKAIGGLMVGTAGIAFLWIDLALVVKRLHDLDLPGAHIFWVSAPSVLSMVLAGSVPNALIALFWVTHFVIGLWLLFAPGSIGENRFGLPSGAARPLAPTPA